MKLSVSIPFRDADGTRTRAKDWILARWQHFYPDAEFIVEPDDGIDPFNKSMAVNKAAAKASGDVFAILDADTWVDPKMVAISLDLIAHGAHWVVPARRSLRLKQDVSEQIMALPPETKLPSLTSAEWYAKSEQKGFVVGFLWFVPRSGWERLGGMDERFRGWGGEDSSFTKAANVLLGVHKRLPGTVLSLWHARPRDERHQRIWHGQERHFIQAKEDLAHRYTAARNVRSMQAVLSEQGGPLWAS